MISYVILGGFFFVPLLLYPSSFSSDLTSHARKRKDFARTKFVWPVDNVINISLLVQVGFLWFWYAAVCKPARYRFCLVCDFPFVFRGWNCICMKFSNHNQWFHPHSKQLTYHTAKWHFYIHCRQILLHVLENCQWISAKSPASW
jgi:hypothetical protein